MSVPFPPRPQRIRPQPQPGPSRRAPVAPRVGAKVPAWGWLETILISQTFFTALMFVPGLAKIRTATRMASYLIYPLVWFIVSRSPRRRPGAASFPARSWLLFCLFWLVLSVFHPNTNSLLAATAAMAYYISVFSPAFWAPSVLVSSRQIPKLLAVLFLCNALSALVGIGQVYRPATFSPPEHPGMASTNLVYQTTDGRMILRPSGLTDTPGGAALAGVTAAMIGLCWGLRPMAVWKRLASLALAFLGVGIIYFTHVRMAMVMLVVSLAALTGMFVLQRQTRQALLLVGGSVAVLLGALSWVAVSAGPETISRFATLINGDPMKLYIDNRHGFVQHAFEDVLINSPLGYGMGWWGMINMYFGSSRVVSPVWVELMWQAWAYDGGIPLLIGYVGAIGLAMRDSIRIALNSPNRDLAYWAAVIVALNVSALASCFCTVTFLTPIGVQFWLLAAALHAADLRARAGN